VKGLTLEICKKFRLKDEQKKELAELDTGAIISHSESVCHCLVLMTVVNDTIGDFFREIPTH